MIKGGNITMAVLFYKNFIIGLLCRNNNLYYSLYLVIAADTNFIKNDHAIAKNSNKYLPTYLFNKCKHIYLYIIYIYYRYSYSRCLRISIAYKLHYYDSN